MSTSSIEIHISAFAPDERAQHGGVKRSRQLSGQAAKQGRIVRQLPKSHMAAFRDLWFHPWSILVAFVSALPLFGSILSVKGLFAAVLYGGWLHSELRKNLPSEVHLEIGPNLPVLLGNMLISFGVKVSAYPHNIEFLVPQQSQSYFFGQGGARRAELRVYRNSEAVHTISKFDSAVLKCMSVKRVEFLTYVPPEEDLAFLHQIRKNRSTSVKQRILILGSTLNLPTRDGIIRLLDLIRAEACTQNFILAGYGTEELSSLAPKNVLVRGTVSHEELHQLMTHAEAMLIYQVQTSGMLTRLVEASIARIPVYVVGGYVQALEFAGNQVVSLDRLSQLPLERNADQDINLKSLNPTYVQQS